MSTAVGKKFYSIYNARTIGDGAVNIIAPIVVECRTNVPSVFAMYIPGAALFGFLVHDYFSFRRYHCGCIVVIFSMQLMIGGKREVNA